MALKTVLFDIGGTLVRSQSLSKAAKQFREYVEATGMDETVLDALAQEYLSKREAGMKNFQEATIAKSLDNIEKRLVIKISAAEKQKILRVLYNISFSSIAQLYEGTKELLSYLHKRELNIGLISNTPWPGVWHEEKLKKFGILHYFKLRIWSSDEGIRKPHPALFKKALTRFKTKPTQAIYLGDKFDRDVRGANSVNMPVIWINSLMADEGVKFNGWRVDNLGQALEIVKSL